MAFSIDTGGTLETSLVAYYKLDDVNDSFGSNHLTNYNSVVFTTGKLSNGALFDGTNYLMKTNPLSTATTNLSIFCWVYIATTSEMGCFVKNGITNDSDLNGYGLGVGSTSMDGAGNNLIGLCEGVAWMNFGTAIGTGWHYVGMINSAGTWTGYIDNVACATTFTSSARTPTGHFLIGADLPLNSNSWRYWNNKVDEVGFWNKALSSTERTDLYNSGIGDQYNGSITTSTTTTISTSTSSTTTSSSTSTSTSFTTISSSTSRSMSTSTSSTTTSSSTSKSTTTSTSTSSTTTSSSTSKSTSTSTSSTTTSSSTSKSTSTSTSSTTTSSSTSKSTTTSSSTSTSISTSTTTLAASCTFDQQFTTEPNNAAFVGTTTSHRAGQQFTPSITSNVCNIQVKFTKLGSPTDNVKLEIWSLDENGLPSSSLGEADTQASGSAVSAWPGNTTFDFNFTNGPRLISGTKYAFVVTRTGSDDNSNCYGLMDYSTSDYGGGILLQETNGWATVANFDAYFKEYYDNSATTTSTSTSSTTTSSSTTESTSTSTSSTTTSSSTSKSTTTSTSSTTTSSSTSQSTSTSSTTTSSSTSKSTSTSSSTSSTTTSGSTSKSTSTSISSTTTSSSTSKSTSTSTSSTTTSSSTSQSISTSTSLTTTQSITTSTSSTTTSSSTSSSISISTSTSSTTTSSSITQSVSTSTSLTTTSSSTTQSTTTSVSTSTSLTTTSTSITTTSISTTTTTLNPHPIKDKRFPYKQRAGIVDP